jgi:hypothetical protein
MPCIRRASHYCRDETSCTSLQDDFEHLQKFTGLPPRKQTLSNENIEVSNEATPASGSPVAAHVSPYTLIDSERGVIRLLELVPGSFDDGIEMRLIVSSLSAGPPRPSYEALSYVWGTESASQKVSLNNIPVEITLNLDCALRHLRHEVKTRTLWIDALSTNQDDTQERSHQVQIMGKIYSAAQSVIIWLDPVKSTNLHLKALLGAMQFHFSNESATPTTLFDYACSVISLIEANTSANPKDCLLDALQWIVERPWFGRVWVVQELALARTARVHIGPYSFPWQPFERFMAWLPHHNFDPRARAEFAEAAARVVKFEREAHFSSQLCRTVHLSATDPRDKVFSILGISRFSSKPIMPDYTKSAQRVFSEAASAVLSMKKLDIYFHAPLHPLRDGLTSEPLPRLPSWVPDLRITGAVYTRKHVGYTGYRTDVDVDPSKTYHRPTTILGRSQYDTPIEDFLNNMLRRLQFAPVRFATDLTTDLTRLIAPGLGLGEIVKTSGDRLYDIGETKLCTGLPIGVYRLYHNIAQPHGITALNFVRALMRPWSDIRSHERFREEAARQLFDPRVRQSTVPKAVWEAAQELCVDIKRNAANRTLFITGNGGVGLTYHSDPDGGIRHGDLVVGLFGVNFPFVLRKNENSTYTMMNVCDVVDHTWGHDFLGNQEGLYYAANNNDSAKTGRSLKDCEKFGMQEYVIV